MPDALADREIVVAGGTGGLGSATVRLLASGGARVVAGYLRPRDDAPFGASVGMVQGDITSEEGRKKLLAAAPRLYGLVVFPGSPARVAHPSKLDEALAESHRVNYAGPILLARAAAEAMRAAGTAGAIVLVSTMQAVALFPGSTAYSGAKTALVQAARILAKECRGRADIRVNVVCPGVNDAGMARASVAAGKYQRYLDEGIIPRYGNPEDVARAVRFLLEPDCYITGQVLTVDGGLTL